jgi:hypothetical protein
MGPPIRLADISRGLIPFDSMVAGQSRDDGMLVLDGPDTPQHGP